MHKDFKTTLLKLISEDFTQEFFTEKPEKPNKLENGISKFNSYGVHKL